LETKSWGGGCTWGESFLISTYHFFNQVEDLFRVEMGAIGKKQKNRGIASDMKGDLQSLG